MRIITIISGILLVLSGLWCIVNQGATFAALAFVLGIVMIIAGIVGVISFFVIKDRPEGVSWTLAEAIIAVILGIIVLSNQLATDLTIIMFFGMWLLFSGCNRLVASLAMKNKGSKNWGWVCILAVLSMIAGVYAFWNFALAALAMGMLIGIFFLIQGVNILSLGILMPHTHRHNHNKKK